MTDLGYLSLLQFAFTLTRVSIASLEAITRSYQSVVQIRGFCLLLKVILRGCAIAQPRNNHLHNFVQHPHNNVSMTMNPGSDQDGFAYNDLINPLSSSSLMNRLSMNSWGLTFGT